LATSACNAIELTDVPNLPPLSQSDRVRVMKLLHEVWFSGSETTAHRSVDSAPSWCHPQSVVGRDRVLPVGRGIDEAMGPYGSVIIIILQRAEPISYLSECGDIRFSA
jgi:hypothetical protein